MNFFVNLVILAANPVAALVISLADRLDIGMANWNRRLNLSIQISILLRLGWVGYRLVNSLTARLPKQENTIALMVAVDQDKQWLLNV